MSGSLDTHIRVWKADSGQCLHTLKGLVLCKVYAHLFDGVHCITGHQSLTSGMELKSNTLVSGNADSTVKVSGLVVCSYYYSVTIVLNIYSCRYGTSHQASACIHFKALTSIKVLSLACSLLITLLSLVVMMEQ